MKQRYNNSPEEVGKMNTSQLRNNFLIEDLMTGDGFQFYYSHYERLVIGGLTAPVSAIQLLNVENFKSGFFMERREMGVINTGGKGTVLVEGNAYPLDKLDCLYVGRGFKEISFESATGADPAKFFIISAPAHKTYPVRLMKKEEASPAQMGASKTANERIIYKYIHQDGIKSCQLVMGLTVLKPGSVWNTMPAHTHDRRSEVYYYFDLQEHNVVFHMMGQSEETRHLVVNNEQAIISPPWSVHAGSGTSNYTFIWAMAGENQSFADMDAIPISELK